ncbi:MAG: MFS transporter [Nitrospinota bacterium]
MGRGRALHYGWVVALMGLLTTIGAHGFGRMTYTVILPDMKEGLGLIYAPMGLLATGNFLGYLVAALLGGMLATRYGSRLVISLSLLLIGLSMILTGFARSFEFALAMRTLTGLGNGGAYVPAMALGSAWFSMRRRGFATGVIAAGIGGGTLLAGILVPPIIEAHGSDGWRFAWYYLGGAVLIISGVCLAAIRNRPEELGLKPVGAEEAPGEELEEAKAKEAATWKEVYRLRRVWHLGAVYFAYGFSYVIYWTFFAAFLVKEMGMSYSRAGSLVALVGGLSIICGILWGGLSDLLGRRWGLTLSYGTLALAYTIFALEKSPAGHYLSAVIFGVTAWSVPVIMAAAAGDYVGPRLSPAGLGFITIFFGLGQALGPWVGGALADSTGSFTLPFLLAAAVSLAGALGSQTLRKGLGGSK